jgi:hexosaminidase
MSANILLLPYPRSLKYLDGRFDPHLPDTILIDCREPKSLLFSARRFQAALLNALNIRWEISAASVIPRENAGLTLHLSPETLRNPQSYHLQIAPNGIHIQAYDEAGIFYGVCTLIQIISQAKFDLPCLEIIDQPDYPVRGVMLDISRDKVYKLETLFNLVDRMAGWKINQLQLYTEHTYAYYNHPQVWEKTSPMTGEDILKLDLFCRERHVELVANQNSFGHMTRWLKLPRYSPLAETTGKFNVPWGTMQGPFSFAPENPGTWDLIHGLYDELLPHFTSRMINVGCDETFDLGSGQSKDICEKRGVGKVYLDFLLKIYSYLKQSGVTMQFWGDMILHYPGLLPDLPRDVIPLIWGYDAQDPFNEQTERLAKAGMPFYVCPGTSAWLTLAGRTDNCLANLLNAAQAGINHGSIGYLNTDWGDLGHWQVLPVSYLGLSMGAAYSWCLENNKKVDVSRLVSLFAFDDPSGVMGDIAYEMGNLYQKPGLLIPNSSAIFWLLRYSLEEIREYRAIDPLGLKEILQSLDEMESRFTDNRMAHPDAQLITREYKNTIRLIRHACKRGLLSLTNDPSINPSTLKLDMEESLEEFRAIWLERNRPGGLEDSTMTFYAKIKEYKQ